MGMRRILSTSSNLVPRPLRVVALVLVVAPLFSGCLWLNTLFNGRKAWDTAERSRETRFRKNPMDTIDVNPDEKNQYLRAISKGAKVLEVYPKDTAWHPEALILIGRSQQRLSDFDKAVRTYAEIVDRHPDSKRYMGAVQGTIECLLALGRFAEAADWMRRMDSLKIEGGPAGLAWMRAQLALGRGDTTTARQELSRILGIAKAPIGRKADAAWLLGNLAWAQKDWDQARDAYLRPEILHLPYLRRFQCRLYATLALERKGQPREAVAELRQHSMDSRWSRSIPDLVVETGRIEFGQGWYSEGILDLSKLEKMLDPPDKVAEGLVLLGEDARLRRIDVREAFRVFEIGARAGGNTFWGNRARELASALSDLAKLREQRTLDTAWTKWNFDLAELYLLRLGGRDSARAAYGRILSDTSAKPSQKARATYALAWISDDERSDSATFDPAPWLQVAQQWPGTDFAKAAQRNAGVLVTTQTREDSAETVYRQAEKLWMDESNPSAALELYKTLVPKYRETVAGRRSLFAIGWIHDNIRHDSAKAAKAYKEVVDSLAGTAWARKAEEILKGQPRDFLEGVVRNHQLDEDFEEGSEQIDATKKLGPRAPTPPGLLSPDEPDAIPPSADEQLLQPDDFD
jgi:tetratricopeptide (TPR) repeat protein